MQRNANRTGSIVFEPDRNKYKAFCALPSGRRISKRFDTPAAAQEWLTTTYASIIKHSFVEPSSLTVGAWLVSYLKDYKAQTVAPKTIDLYTLLAGKCEPISGIKLQSVTAQTIQSFYAELQDTQSVEMVRKVHRFLHSAFAKARQIGLLSVNVVSAAEPPKRTDKKDIETFSPDEVAAIYDAAKRYSHGRYYPFIMLAFASGARLGELLGLCWDCVDFDADEITLKRNLTDTLSAGLQLSTPKTKAGIRTISIPPTVMVLLRDMKRAAGIVTMRSYVFITSNGTPFLPRNFQRIWSNIVKLSGIPHKNFHVIRHTHATELLAAGAPIADVSRRLGHSKISHTLDLYGHAIPRMDKILSQKVSSIFSI